jgi:hypothetical protein
MDRPPRPAPPIRWLALAATVALAACGAVAPSKGPRVYEQESFDTRNAFSREFVGSPADTCSAARRALLSQGYVVQATGERQLGARKHFQPDTDTHVQIEFSIVCASAARSEPTAIAFVSAVQDRYEVKKNPTSASVGVSPFGSISLPLTSTSDSLVKTGSETIPPGRFYDRFFDLVERFLSEANELDAPPAPAARAVPSGAAGR